MTTDRMDPAALRRNMEKEREAAQPKKDDVDDADYTDELPAVTSIDFDFTDERGKRYKGRFTFTVPTLGDSVTITQLKSAMLPNGAKGDPIGAFLAEMMCYLEVTLGPDRPKWWAPHRFYDAKILSEMYGRCRSYEARFRGIEEAVDRGPAQEDEEGSDSSGEDPVEQEVQPPAKRRETLATHTPRSDRAGASAGRARGGAKRSR